MTKRMLHENITTSDKFSKVGFEAECLYNRLLTQTDDYGNVRGSIGYIKDVCFPKNKPNKKIDYQMVGKWLSECLHIGLLCGYQVDGIEYLHFNRFEDFQTLRKDRIKNSSIPMFTPMQPNGYQVDNQMVTKCQHEVEVEVEVEVEDKYTSEVNMIVDCLNRVCSTSYKYSSVKTKELIIARLKEGFNIEDFETVIEKKFNEWNGTEMSKFLRPETLFSNKFEGYVNQQINKTLTKGEKNARVSDDIIRSISQDNEVNGNFLLTI